ncbi:MAG: hypothetical protein C0502_12170, partial [Opitutus sp.]|nr:hypothetical protein [Opitutus sp.]
MVHHGVGHEHHRGVGDRPGRQPRIRDLEIRCRAPAPGRAPLHDCHPREVAPMPQVDALHLTRWTVTSGSNVQSRGAVVIEAGDHHWQASSQGNGAVDALFGAVDKALAAVLNGHPRLVGYEVRALGEGPGAEGLVSVRIRPPA